MHPTISRELTSARIADLHRQGWPRRQHRFGLRLWILLHAHALIDGPAAAASDSDSIEDDYRRFAARREVPAR